MAARCLLLLLIVSLFCAGLHASDTKGNLETLFNATVIGVGATNSDVGDIALLGNIGTFVIDQALYHSVAFNLVNSTATNELLLGIWLIDGGGLDAGSAVVVCSNERAVRIDFVTFTKPQWRSTLLQSGSNNTCKLIIGQFETHVQIPQLRVLPQAQNLGFEISGPNIQLSDSNGKLQLQNGDWYTMLPFCVVNSTNSLTKVTDYQLSIMIVNTNNALYSCYGTLLLSTSDPLTVALRSSLCTPGLQQPTQFMNAQWQQSGKHSAPN